MSFERPLLLLTLLLVPAAVGAYLLAERRRMRYAVRFTNLDVLAGVVAGRQWRRHVPPVLLLLALATLCAALARPHVERLVPKERAAVILVVDESRSMEARDVRPTRLAAAQAAVRSFLDRAPDRLRVGLIVFSGEAHVAAPPTTDRELLREAVDGIGRFRSYGGTAIGDALAAAVALGQQAVTEFGPDGTVAIGDARLAAYGSPVSSHESRGLVSILFLSDGAQTRGVLQPLEGAQRAKQAGMRVYTIALGTPEGTVPRGFRGGFGRDFGPALIPVPPDPATLRAIAETTGGRFSEARTAESLTATYELLGSSLGREPGKSEVTFVFLAAAAALLLLGGVLSAVWSPRIP